MLGQILPYGCAFVTPFCLMPGYIGLSNSSSWPKSRLLLLSSLVYFFCLFFLSMAFGDELCGAKEHIYSEKLFL